MSFVCPQFKCQTFLFDSYQVVPLRARVDLEAMDNEVVLCFPQSSLSDCLMSYLGH